LLVHRKEASSEGSKKWFNVLAEIGRGVGKEWEYLKTSFSSPPTKISRGESTSIMDYETDAA